MAPNENQLQDSLSWPNKPFLSFFRCSATGMQDTAVSTAGGGGVVLGVGTLARSALSVGQVGLLGVWV